MKLPTSAFLSISLRCNSQCLMCNIWKNKSQVFLKPEICKKLPHSLENIDITGGEPFLHPDLPKIVEVLRQTCPKARILVTTNGLLANKIAKIVSQMLSFDKNLAFRVSLDGFGKVHDEVRGVPKAFERVLQTINVLKTLQVKDIGVIFTLMEKNRNDLQEVLTFCKRMKLNFSINLVHDSEIYFGFKHLNLRPTFQETKKALILAKNFYRVKVSLRSLAKIWFYDKLLIYLQTGKRPIPCGAGESFFYLDSRAKVYPCHFKNWKIGNLKDQSFEEIWYSKRREKYLKSVRGCQDCFMVCTAKDEIKKRRWKVLEDILVG